MLPGNGPAPQGGRLHVIDLSHPVSAATPVYPGDTPARFDRVRTLGRDGFNAYRVSGGQHIGTHVDAPLHMLEDGQMIDAYPAEAFVGRAAVLDARGERVVGAQHCSRAMLEGVMALLICTGHAALFGGDAYFAGYPVLDVALARLIVSSGVQLVGMDTPAPDMAPHAVHKLLFGANICIIENMTNLEQLIGDQSFVLVAVPVRLHAEGAPVRAVALMGV